MTQAPSKQLSAAMKVAEGLIRFERLIDQVVSAGADLTAALPRARADANFPAVVGQHALDSMGEAMSAAIAARRHAVAAHRHLEKVQETTGLPIISWGDETPKPPRP
jgi:hypothetical protein